MIRRFPCPYLNGEVELTEERERHITERHADLLPERRPRLAETLAVPDHIRTSARFGRARLFSRWSTDVRQGKSVVVVVVSECTPQERHWIITAHLARRLAQGGAEWQRA
jgi:hypothetical protein